MASGTELLVVLDDPGHGGDTISALRRTVPVTQSLPPRLALVAIPDGWAPAAVPGATWYEDDVPPTVLDSLTDTERMFVAAWQARRAGKRRPGDGLPWDSPGFQPPDPPTRAPG
jgi:hypothetical protein